MAWTRKHVPTVGTGEDIGTLWAYAPRTGAVFRLGRPDDRRDRQVRVFTTPPGHRGEPAALIAGHESEHMPAAIVFDFAHNPNLHAVEDDSLAIRAAEAALKRRRRT
ncbi:MAG: hypothetical protein ACRDT6_18635 [Micromonosporaceae bacterium]